MNIIFAYPIVGLRVRRVAGIVQQAIQRGDARLAAGAVRRAEQVRGRERLVQVEVARVKENGDGGGGGHHLGQTCLQISSTGVNTSQSVFMHGTRESQREIEGESVSV